MLSPFEVVADQRGYYASSTMSGTRLNSKVDDLAASISVVTKQQMEDFALLDINDVFLYEANTEGTGTFTDVTANADGVPIDNTQMDPNNANRVRGVSSANMSLGNFQTTGQVPVDPINIDAIEINRGPNSSVFGLGNAGGTINLQPASANLRRNRSEVTMRVDSFDGYRTSIDLNRVLKQDTLAVRGSAVYQHDGFDRKPSGTDTTRLNAMMKYKPLKYTTLTASYLYYHLDGNRPNTTMPLDAVSAWLKAGRPTYDPIDRVVHLNGETLGPFIASTMPAYFSMTNGVRSWSSMAIDGNGELSLWMPLQTSGSAVDPAANKQNIFFAVTGPEPLRSGQPLWASNPVVSSKEIYDWSSINLAAMNRLRQTTTTALVNLEQIFFSTPRQLLAAQAGFYREDGKKYARNIMGGASSSGRIGYLHIDANERLPNGQPNPFFLAPFIGRQIPGSQDNPSRRETGRLQLAYKLDLSQERSALRWLGVTQLVGYGEYMDSVQRQISYMDVILSDHSWITSPLPRATVNSGPNTPRNYFRYYVGDNVGSNVDFAPRDFTPGWYDYTWGNGLTGVFKTEPALLGPEIGIPGGTGGTNNSRRILKSEGIVAQNHLLGGRIVTTVGLRRDRNYNKRGAPVEALSDRSLDWDTWNRWDEADWGANSGTTKTAGVVIKPLSWLGVHANASDSFQPAGAAVDIFLRPLPDPTGTGTDYGLTLKLFDGKLVTRINRYETKQLNSRAGTTAARRVRGIDFEYATTTGNSSSYRYLDTDARQWVTEAAAASGQTLTQEQITAQVATIMGIDPKYLVNEVDNNMIAETADVLSKGTEIEVNYNPTSFWTAKLNVVQMETINIRLSPAVTQWISERMPNWQKIVDPDGRPWFTTNYSGSTREAFLAQFVTTPLSVDKALEGKSRPQIRKYRANLTTRYRLAGLTEHAVLKRFTVGGALRWEDKGAIGYYGVEQPPAVVTALDPNRPVWDKAHFYVDAFLGYRTRLFADKVGVNFQLNVRNLQESGRLQPTNAYPDGTPWTYRIIDPRQFIFTATFDF